MIFQLILENPHPEHIRPIALHVQLKQSGTKIIPTVIRITEADGETPIHNWIPELKQLSNALQSLKWAAKNDPHPPPQDEQNKIDDIDYLDDHN